MAGYRYLLDCTVVEQFITLPAHARRFLLATFRQIADDPFQAGEAIFQDSSGRDIQKKQFGIWNISFWPDHAVKELRIVGIQRAKR